MKKILLAALFLVSVFGFISVITAKADSEPDQSILDDALKAVRSVPAAQLTDQERNQLICTGMLHACFKGGQAAIELLIAQIRSSLVPFEDSQRACALVNTNACPNSTCVERLLTASGNGVDCS
jgi:hypothetical protein